MNKPFSTLSLSALLVALTGVGLSAQASSPERFPLTHDYRKAYIQPLHPDASQPAQWVIANPGQGVRIVDSANNILSQLNINAEFLDLRHGVTLGQRQTTIVATVALPEQQALLLALDANGQLQEVNRLPSASFLVENLCLQRDHDDNIYLYLLDERGKAEHWLVLDRKGNTQARQVRTLPIAPNSAACSVDDAQGILYVAEEEVGVWGYNASPEASPGRWPVDLTGPFGQLAGGSEALTAIPGGVIAISLEQRRLQVYRAEGDQVTLHSHVDLPALAEPERISRPRRLDDQTLEFVVYDDDDGHHHRLTLPWQTPATAPATRQVVEVLPVVQTAPVARFGDSADDPAIWVNARNPRHSRVLGTDKKYGLYVYDLQGKELQFIPSGKVNNVDVRYGLRVGRNTVDIAIASDRDDDSLAVYTINQRTGVLTEAGNIPTTLKGIYGFCMYQPASGEIYAIANNKRGNFEQYRISVDNGQIGGTLVRRFKVDSQPEGCVADDENRQLYVGEEARAVWVIGADPEAGTELQPVIFAGGSIVADIEGLALYKGKHKDYLVISSQGNDTYVVIEAEAPYRERGIFRIGVNASAGIDATSETDGLEVTSRNLGGVFSEGMLVVQDGHNVMPEAPQNFKYVPWSSIREALNLD